jgi:hypothetical protein
MVTPPHELLTTGTEYANGMAQSVVEPLAGVANFSDIHDFLHGSLKDGLITRENAPIAIYNATSTSGLAGSEAKTLESYGYNVKTVDTAPNATGSSSDILVDLSKGTAKYTAHYLEGRLGVASVSKVPSEYGITPPQGTKFVIILGNESASSQN